MKYIPIGSNVYNDPTNVDLTSSYHYFLPHIFLNSFRKSRLTDTLVNLQWINIEIVQCHIENLKTSFLRYFLLGNI